MNLKLSENVMAQINELNNKVNDLYGYRCNDIIRWIADLDRDSSTVVGYRAGCGSLDKTHKTFLIWKKAVKILSKNSIKLNEESLIVANKSPTMAGGFWNEVRYFL